MAEEQGGGSAPEAAQQPQEPQQQAQEARIPDGYVPKSEIEQLEQRHRQRETTFQGWKPYYEGAQKLGIKPDEFGQIGELLSAFPKHWTHEQKARTVKALMNGEQPTGADDAGDGPDFQSEIDKVRAEMRKELASSEHTRQLESAHSGFKGSVSKLMDEFGVKRDTIHGKSLEAYANSLFDHASSMFDEDHPLHGTHLRPPDEKGIAGVIETLRKEFESSKGAEINEAAEAAARPGSRPTAPTAGQGPGTPGAKDQQVNSPRNMTEHLAQKRAAAEKLLARNKAARGGSAVSSAGG